MESRVSRTLGGTKRVRITERSSGAWGMAVVVGTSDVLDATASENAAKTAKPMGIVLTFAVSDLPLIDEGTREIDKATTDTIDTATVADVT
jgi:hypothetical protein